MTALPMLLLGAYVLIWLLLAIAPRYRQDWLLENVLVLGVVPGLVLGFRHLRFSNASYVAIFAFMVLHAIGAHFTYSEVPYEQWSRALFGVSFNELMGFERNHYDRAVHFFYGALVTPAVVELIAVVASPKKLWRWLLPLCFVMSHSVVYEMIEWAAALVFGGELGEAYLGTQGDTWDAQKDMALATLGSLVTVIFLAINRDRHSKFGVTV
jgi:putative membrane protein